MNNMRTREEKLQIYEITDKHFSEALTDMEKYLDDKSIPIENYKKDIIDKLNKLGNDLLGDLIKL